MNMPQGCFPFSKTSGGAAEKNAPLTVPLSTDTVYKHSGGVGGTFSVAEAVGTKYLLLAMFNQTDAYFTSTTPSAGGIVTPAPTVTEEVARAINVTLASSKGSDIHNAVAKVAKKGISSNGARVIINDINPDDIATVTLNGKALKVYTSDAGSAIAIPKGSQSGDLVFTMSDGTVVKAYDAVSITATKDPAKVKARELPTFAANSTVVPAAVKAAIKARKAAILKADNAQCIGYATANTDAAKAAAKKRANKVCGIITDINEEIEPLVAVLVKKKAGVAYKIW